MAWNSAQRKLASEKAKIAYAKWLEEQQKLPPELLEAKRKASVEKAKATREANEAAWRENWLKDLKACVEAYKAKPRTSNPPEDYNPEDYESCTPPGGMR